MEQDDCRRVRVGDIWMNVYDGGHGPAVLLVHGFPDTHQVWRHQIRALRQAGYRVVAPDTRGNGDSDMPAHVSDYRLETMAADLVRLLDVLGIDKVRLVGHDLGAFQAWFMASLYPERVERLIALSVGHPSCYARGGLMQKLKSWYVWIFQLRGIAERIVTACDWLAFRVVTNLPQEYPHWRAALERPGRLTAGMNFYRANIGHLLRPPRLRPLPMPARGIFSTGDRYVTERQMALSASYVAVPFGYDRIIGACHWMQLSAPEQVNALLLKHLQEGATLGDTGLEP